MVPLSSVDVHGDERLGNPERALALRVAREAIVHGVERGRPLHVNPAEYPAGLCERRACFVTLYQGEQLRGCVGSLRATQPLIVDVARNAYASAFSDPRFSPLVVGELRTIQISLSVLSALQPIVVASEAALYGALRPGVDGLVLREGSHSGTFLPAVWSRFSSPGAFVAQLKLKAGLPASYWSTSMTFERYTTECFSEELQGCADV